MKQLVRVFQQFTSFEGNVFRYSLAFSLLLAFAPGIIFCVAIFMAFYLDPLIIIEYGTRFLPKDYLIPFVEYVLESSSFSLGFIITTLIALWLASKSIYSFLLINAKVERHTLSELVDSVTFFRCIFNPNFLYCHSCLCYVAVDVLFSIASSFCFDIGDFDWFCDVLLLDFV